MELKQVKENVRKMVSLGAPEEDIDGYIAAAGYTVEEVKNYQPPQYSALEKAIYTGRAAAEGATLGLGDVLAGATNTIMSPLAKTITALKEGTPLTAQDFNPIKNFKEGRGDFVREQEDFKEAQPGLNFVGELGGGLVTGIGGVGKVAGAKMLGKLGKWGTAAATGAASGAGYGFGTGLTRDADELSPGQGLKEAVPGAFLGGAFGVAVPAVFGAGSKIVNKLKKTNRAYQQLSKAANGKLEESIETGVPLIDTADKKALRLIEGANLADDEASEILGKYANGRMERLQEEAQGTLDNIFGKKGYDTLLKESHERGQELAAPLYAKAFSKGKVNINLDPYQQVMARELRTDPYSGYFFRNVPDNDFRFLDAIKKGMDYKISATEEAIKNHTLKKSADGASIEALKRSRERLLSALDKASPHYRLARSVAEQGIKFEEGAKAGQRAFLDPAADIASKVKDMGRKGRKPDWEGLRQKALTLKAPGAAERQLAQIDLLETIYNASANAERRGYRVGAGLEMRKRLEGSGANWRNYYQELFNKNRLRKLEAMGVDTRKFLPEIEKGKKTANNMRNLFRGSQTSERDENKIFFKPMELLKKQALKLINKAWVVSPQDIARMSIDPGYAAVMRAKAGALPPSAYVDISGAGGVFANIWGPLTKKEGDAYRKQVQRKLINNKAFSRKEVNKMIGSSANIKKLDVLNSLNHILQNKPTTTVPSQTPRFRYEIYPIRTKNGPDVAAVTKRDGRVYNVNLGDFFLDGLTKKNFQGLPRSQSAFNGSSINGTSAVGYNPSGKSMPKNSIANNQGKNKWAKNNFRSIKDFLILLQRPFTLGLQGNIAAQNSKEGK